MNMSGIESGIKLLYESNGRYDLWDYTLKELDTSDYPMIAASTDIPVEDLCTEYSLG